MLYYFQHSQRAICHLRIWWITSYYTVSAKQCRLIEVKHLQYQLQNNKTDCLSSKGSTCQRLRAGIGLLWNCLSCLRGKRRLHGHAVIWTSACATGYPPQTQWWPPIWQYHLPTPCGHAEAGGGCHPGLSRGGAQVKSWAVLRLTRSAHWQP